MPNSGKFLSPEAVVDILDLDIGMSVADFGCGSGHLVYSLAEQVGPTGSVYAVDIDEEMVSSARNYVASKGLDNVKYLQADVAGDLLREIPKASLDFVFLSNVLYVLGDNKKKALYNTADYLKNQGHLIVIEWKQTKTLFGPALKARLKEDDAKKIVTNCGFRFIRQIDAGMYHYGMEFEVIKENFKKNK